jgi:hypothetical protein
MKIENPKTTIGGYLLIIAAVISACGKLIAGQLPDMADATMVISGIGLIMAKDGGH